MNDKGFVNSLKKELKLESWKKSILTFIKDVKLDINFSSKDRKLNVEVEDTSVDATGRVECDFSKENDNKVNVSISKK